MRNKAIHIFSVLLLMTGVVMAAMAQGPSPSPRTIKITGNVYGGGEMAQVDGNTNVTINAGSLGADIFGGGEGKLNNDGTVSMSADVSGATHVTINGGEFAVESEDGNFKKHYNIYGGGNIASQVGETHVYVKKGMISNASAGRSDFLHNGNANGIAKVYYQEGQMYFCIFGGGFGKNTSVTGNTWVDFHINGMTDINSTAIEDDLLEYQSYLDVIGGGFNGTVLGNTNVHVGGNAMCRDVFGGGLYATIGTQGQSTKGNTNVYITGGNVDNVYGGGVMGDIFTSTNTYIGLHETLNFDFEADGVTPRAYAQDNNKVTVLMSVYGGNAVSGRVETANVYHYGGQIDQNLFGAGNGDFTGYYTPGLCAFAEGENDNYYEVDHSGDTGHDGVTKGPKGNTYKGRPQTGNVNITIAGNDTDDKAEVLGQVFGGGNSCTIGNWVTPTADDDHDGNPHEWRDDPAYFQGGGALNVTVGNHVKIGRSHKELVDAEDEEYLNKEGENVSGLFMGCSGRYLATQETDAESNAYHHFYDRYTAKYWPGFAVFDNEGNPLDREAGLASFNAYMNNILVWSDNVNLHIADDAEDIWLANFVGGGFRGSMKAKTASGRFAYTLPEGVTVGNAIVGGAYNTDVVYRVYDTESDMHTYTVTDGHYQYCTTVKPGWDEGEDYHHVERDEEGNITGIVRFYYDGGMLANDGVGRIHQVHADPRADAAEYATAYFEPLTSGDNQESSATKAKLYTANKNKAFLSLSLRCALEPEVLLDGEGNHSVHGGNVFGGCFMSGLVQGDSWVDYGAWLSPNCTDTYYFDKSDNMRIYAEAADLVRNNALNVFGAGYGENTHTAGDTYLYIKAISQSAGGDGNMNGKYPYMFNAFGGSYAGRVYGNTNVYYAVGQQGTLLGSLYGGGYKGDIDGNTFVELAEGFVANVYGGSRQANIGGAAHVWAYDGKYRGINDANHLIICNLYGGNDIAGEIQGTMPAAFAASKWSALESVELNTYVEISADNNEANRGFPLIGSAYAGGNGQEWTDDKGAKPNVGNALIEIGGGSTLRAFGGGNMATVTDSTYIFSDATSTNFANVTFSAYQKNIMQKVFFNDVPTGYTWEGTTLTMDPYHVVKLYGGNNVAEMAIQPTWNLLKGKLGSVYSGGNLGNMTYYYPSGTPAAQGQLNPTPKGLHIDVSSDLVEINELYGGCRMADVIAKDGEGNPVTFAGADEYGATVNVSGGRINNVYGGNDIAGHVYNGTNVNITGAISGDVYGSGNGNYVYKYDATDEAPEVGVMEERVKGEPGNVDYIYYAFKGTDKNATAMQKLQAINAIRPNVDKAYLNIAGTESNLVYVKGNVYCGGNASTVSGTGSYTKFDIGSYCVLNGVYMGSNGEEMTDATSLARLEEQNGFYFFSNALLAEYMNAVAMAALPQDFTLDTELTDAYIGTFCLGGNRGSMTTSEPVEIDIPSSVKIFNKIVGGCNDAYLSYKGYSTTGGFTTWNEDKTQPKITLNIHAHFLPREMFVPDLDDDRFDLYKAQNFLYTPIENESAATKQLSGKYCNVYGGCYTHGYVYGDVEINMYSNMLGDFLAADAGEVYYNKTKGKKTFSAAEKQQMLANNIAYNETHGRPVFSVFGGGYGQSTVVYGNTHIRLLNNRNTFASASAPIRAAMTDPEPEPLVHPTVNAIYGGGEQGKMIGTSTIHIADGTVYSNVVGGALNGSIYGNTEILVGYPSYYEVQKTGEYKLKRSNFTAAELEYLDGAGNKAVKQSIFLTKGDRINAAVYQAIRDWDKEKGTHQADAANLKLTQNKVNKNWDDIEIDIKGGIYGGGYARENVEDGQTAMANTVLKFTSNYNLADAHPEFWDEGNTLAGAAINAKGEEVYGGNSTIWVQDEINASNWKSGREHITISTETDPDAHTGKGGIFGDGHSSLVAAFRSAAVEGYGYAEHPANAPKLLNTFQRFDILQIRDCSMKMYGDIDVATGQNDPTHYAVSRITELMLNSHIDDENQDLLATSNLNSRNVIDFYNPVHYLGSITSEVTFKPGAAGSRYHRNDGTVCADSSYYDYKTHKVSQNYDYDSHGIHEANGCKEAFGARNEGTAKNLIRIDDPEGRGVHLKVVQENNYAINSQGVKEEQNFYGPLSGVFQFELTNVNARGGGYVYSNNLHEQTIEASDAAHASSADKSKESFLQTSGNVFFVPVHIASINKDRSVYDDCYPIPYSDHGTGELDKAHYWFVEGDGPTWCSYPQKPETVDSLNQIITIETAEQLAWVYDYIDHGYDAAKKGVDTTYSAEHDKYPLNFAGWTIELGNDIDLGQLTILDQREVPMIWCPIADQKGTYFEGTFDGKGFKIDGMLLDVDFITQKNTYGDGNYAEGYDHYFGLFAKTKGATIQNVELSDAKVINVGGNTNEQVHIGTLITEVTGTTVQDCSVQQTDTITSNKKNAVEAAAAFICHTNGAASTIHSNFVSGSIYAVSDSVTAPISGFISRLDNGSTMEHCYSLVDVHAQQVAGLADTVQGNAKLEHSYYAGTLKRENTTTPWGAILANANNANVKHCYYDVTKNPFAKGYRGGDTQVFKQVGGYTNWSTYGLSTADMTDAVDGHVWRSCYGHDHTSEGETKPCEIDAADAVLEGKESAWNKGIWTFIPGFYPFLKSQDIDCSALTTAFQMPTAEALGLTSLDVPEAERWYNVNQHFTLPTYGHMYWTVNNNTLLLDAETKKDQSKVDAHLYLGGPDALTLNCDEYVRWMRDIYVIREDINKQEDLDWYNGLSSDAKTALATQLNVDNFAAGMLRNKEVTNISKKNGAGQYLENGFDGDVHIWDLEGGAGKGTVTNPYQYKVKGEITYHVGYDNPYLWHEVNLPFNVDHASVYRRTSKEEYNIVPRDTTNYKENEDGGNFWLRSFDPSAEIAYGGHTFQQAWHDPAAGENYGHRPSVLRFPKVMKVDGTSYLAGDYWCYDQDNTIDKVDYHNGGSEIRFYSTTGNTVYGTRDYESHIDSRGASGFIVYGNPTLANIQLEGYYWLLETAKRDTLGVNDPLVRPEINTNIAQWFSLQHDPVIPPLGIWIDGPEDFKEQAIGSGSSAPLRISGMHEPGVSEQYGEKEASFTASGCSGILGVFSYIDQVINIYDVNGHLTFTTPVRANTGFTINLPSHMFLVQGTNSPKQVKVML